jgi:hypothetical protein
MDSVDSVSSVLHTEGKIKKCLFIFYQFYFSNKDDAFSTGIPL